MNKKFLIILLAAVIVGIGAYYFLTTKKSDPSGMNMTPAEMEEMDNSSGSSSNSTMLAEDNAVMVSDQRPGMIVTGTVYLASPGYLVIHEDNDGVPGAVLGSSMLLTAGENSNVNVSLSRAMKNGEKLNAMLHSDTDGDGSFDALNDTPVQSKLGGPINGIFQVSSEASEGVPVNM